MGLLTFLWFPARPPTFAQAFLPQSNQQYTTLLAAPLLHYRRTRLEMPPSFVDEKLNFDWNDCRARDQPLNTFSQFAMLAGDAFPFNVHNIPLSRLTLPYSPISSRRCKHEKLERHMRSQRWAGCDHFQGFRSHTLRRFLEHTSLFRSSLPRSRWLLRGPTR